MRLLTIFLLLSSALLCFGLSYPPPIFEQYAERGDAKVQYRLGLQYESGRYGAQDYVKAVKWYRKAAQRGYFEAQLKLGEMYANGEGVAKDDVEALKWYRKAAAQWERRERADYYNNDISYGFWVMDGQQATVTSLGLSETWY